MRLSPPIETVYPPKFIMMLSRPLGTNHQSHFSPQTHVRIMRTPIKPSGEVIPPIPPAVKDNGQVQNLMAERGEVNGYGLQAERKLLLNGIEEGIEVKSLTSTFL